MLLNVAFLIEYLRSAHWDWSVAVLTDLFRALGLAEVGPHAGQATRYFRASSGLACVTFADPLDLTPTGFEFPFTVPSVAGVSAAEMLEQFVRLVRMPVGMVLGPPSVSSSWDVGSSTIVVEARPGQEGPSDVVALVVRRRPVAGAATFLQRP